MRVRSTPQACFIVLIFLAVASLAWSKSYNVYVPFSTVRGLSIMTTWNSVLLSDPIVRSFKLEPFQPEYPSHVSLYLAEYNVNKLSNIKRIVKKLAGQNAPFLLCTNQVYLSKGDWLMVSLTSINAQVHALDTLQKLSDQVVTQLSPLRDKTAPIPKWAKQEPSKSRSFASYGSPNVFSSFEPHLSLSGPPKMRGYNQAAFKKKLWQSIKLHPIPKICATIDTIAMGEVNASGQVTKEMARYPLGA